MSFEEFEDCVDCSFIESWLDKIADTVQLVPDTLDGRTTGSFMAQLAVMAELGERDRLSGGAGAEERAMDFATEFVARLWPLFPVGLKSEMGEELWERMQYVDWGGGDSVQHNIRAPTERALFRDILRDRLNRFASLSDPDKDQIISRSPSVRALQPFFSDRERQIVACLPFELLSDFQREMLTRQLGGSVSMRSAAQSELPLFEGLSADLFESLRENADQIVPLLVVHRNRFEKPPEASHRRTVDLVLGQERFRRSLEGVPSFPSDVAREELAECFWKLTFIISYEAAHQLLLSDGFLTFASGRDARSREVSGLHFWHDLRTPQGKELSTLCLDWLGGFVGEIVPELSTGERAVLTGRSPLCVFLESLRLDEVPDLPVEVIPDDGYDAGEVPSAPPPPPAARPAYQRERTIRVFISSTFRDMQEERDELVKRVFPQLRKLCEERGVTWSEVDLRWGITEEQAQRGDVLPICLREIDRCRPFFIGLLGERYGWVPEALPDELIEQQPWLREHLQMSVTELEIVHGALRNPAIADRVRFYFRNPAYVESLPPEKRSFFLEPDPGHRQKLERLKERIRRSGLAVREDYVDPPGLARMVLEDLTAAIDREYPPESVPDPLERMSEEHEAFARSRTAVYIGREGYFERLDQHAAGGGPPLVVLGVSGSGKSALLAKWTVGYRGRHPDDLVMLHFIGAGAESTGWETILSRAMSELKLCAGIEDNVPQRSDELRSAFPRWLETAAARMAERDARIVIVIDALNQLEDRDGALELAWLPHVLPERVRLVLSTLPGRPLEEINRRDWPTLQVEQLELDERERLIIEYLRQYGKELSPARIDRVAAAPQARNPLFIRALLEELRLFGVFERLDQRIDYYLEAEAIDDLYERILARCEEDYDREHPGLVRDTMSALWASRRGLTEAEILDMLGTEAGPLPRARWSPFFLSIESSLVSRSGLITFFHDYLRKAVADRYLPDDDQRRAAHRRIADYFDGRETDRRQLDELPWQLRRAGEWDRLTERLKVPSFLVQGWRHDAYSLRTYWAEIEANSAHRPEDVYAAIIRQPDDDPAAATVLAHLMGETGRFEIAGELWLAQARESKREGDEHNTAIALQNAAITLDLLGRAEESASLLQEAEAIWRQLGYVRGLQATLGNRAAILRERGNPGEAKRILVEQEDLLRQLGDRPGLARNLNNQALIRKDEGDWDGALELHRQSERLCRELGDLDNLQASLGNQATICLLRDDLDTALELLQRQEQICRESADRVGLQSSLCNQAIVARRKGELDESWRLLEEHERICREIGHQAGIALNLGNKAHILRIRRQYDQALDLYRQVEQLSRRLGQPLGVQLALGNQALVLEDKYDLEGALRARQEQESICRQLGNPHELALCLMKEAELLGVPMGRPKEASPLIEEAERLARQLGLDLLIEQVERVKLHVRMASMY